MCKIGLAVSTIFHYEHLKHVYSKCEDAVFVIFGTSRDKIRSIREHLISANVNHCTLFDVLEQGIRIDILFSVYWQPAFVALGDQVMHVRIMYGYAKDDWNYGEWNKNYDLIFTYGQYASKRLGRYADCIESGHPRLIPGTPGFASRGEQPSGRPTILYCPTYGEHSSLREFDGIVTQLAGTYDIMVKLHHLHDLDGCPNLVACSSSGKLRVHDERKDLFELFPECDLVISDHSGAIFDAMLFKRKILLIDPQNMEAKIAAGLQSLHASLDIKIRNVIQHGNISEIAERIPKVLAAPNPYASWLSELFHAGDDPAQLIHDETLSRHQTFGPANKTARILDGMSRFAQRDSRKMVICGAGDFGQAVWTWLKSKHFGAGFMIDSARHKENSDIGIPVLSPDILDQLSPETEKCIVATVSGGPMYENRLKQAGFVKNRDYVCAYD